MSKLYAMSYGITRSIEVANTGHVVDAMIIMIAHTRHHGNSHQIINRFMFDDNVRHNEWNLVLYLRGLIQASA